MDYYDLVYWVVMFYVAAALVFGAYWHQLQTENERRAERLRRRAARRL